MYLNIAENAANWQRSLLQTMKLLLILALLVSNAAGCLASRLAGCLALAAAAVVNCLYDILCFDSLNSVHDQILLGNIILIYFIILAQY